MQPAKKPIDENIDIRFISENDLLKDEKIIKELLDENFKINFLGIDNFNKYVNDGYQNMLRFQRDGSAILIGAYIGATITGFLWAYRREVLGEQRLHIGHIVVNSCARSRGIGTRLLNKLEIFANENGIKKIELMTSVENENTMKFYQSNGFETVRVQLEKEIG